MTYASQSDMIARFGEDEVIQLTDRAALGVVDAAVLLAALEEADAEINPYLQSRYAVPMVDVPRIIVGYACDIARYRLCGATAMVTEDTRSRYKDAVRFLENAASGKVLLGVSLINTPAVSINPVAVSGSGRTFNRTSLADY
jgi:phage gp36-like protein